MKKTVMRKYAQLAVRRGAHVKKGQGCVIYAQVEQHEFAEMVAEEAYRAGAKWVQVFWQEAVFSMAIAVVVTVSMTWVGLLVINSLLVLPAAAARNVSRNLFQYHLFSLLGAVLAGIAGLMTSYYVGSSAGAAITLYLAVWFFLTFFLRKKG